MIFPDANSKLHDLLFIWFRSPCVLRRCRQKKRPPNLQSLSDTGAGEGVPLQPLPDPKKTHRDRTRSLPDRTTNQNMVPKPSNEVEKGEQDDKPQLPRCGTNRKRWRRRGWRGRVATGYRREEILNRHCIERNEAFSTISWYTEYIKQHYLYSYCPFNVNYPIYLFIVLASWKY